MVIGMLLLNISRILTSKLKWPPIRHYVVAFLGVVVLALGTEVIQGWIPNREPQASDVIHDVLGAMCGLGWSLTTDQSLSGKWARWRAYPRPLFVACGIALITAMTFLPVVEWTYAYWDRANRFPSILQFSSEWEMKFVKSSDSGLQVVVAPQGWNKSTGDQVGRVEFFPKKYPGIRIDEPYPDWRGYSFFQLDIFSELPRPQSMAIRIDDAHLKKGDTDWFIKTLTVVPGPNQIRISLDEIRKGVLGRELDLSVIQAVWLYARSPSEKFSLYFDNLRLE